MTQSSGNQQFPLANEAFAIGAWLFPELRTYAGNINHDSVHFAFRMSLGTMSRFMPAELTSIVSMELEAGRAAATRSLVGYLTLASYLCYHVLNYELYGNQRLAEAGLTRLVSLAPVIADAFHGLSVSVPTPSREYRIREAVRALATWYHQVTGDHLEQPFLDDVYVAWIDVRGAHDRVSNPLIGHIHAHPFDVFGRVVTIKNDGAVNQERCDQVNAAIYHSIGGAQNWPLTTKEQMVSLATLAVNGLSFDRKNGLGVRLAHAAIVAKFDGTQLTLTVSGDSMLDVSTLYGVQVLLYQGGMSGPKTARFDNRGVARFQNVSTLQGKVYRLEINSEG